MVSTASDYARFSQMLLNDGALDGVRLLSPDVVTFMASDHLPPDIAFSPDMSQIFEPLGIAATPRSGQSFGLGFMVRTQRGEHPTLGEPGEFYWQGAWGTAFFIGSSRNRVGEFGV